MTIKKLCNRCLKEKLRRSSFYKFGKYYDSMCKMCRKAYEENKRWQRRMRGDDWYKDAASNKRPLPFDFSVRVPNDQWRLVGRSYVKMVQAYERKLTRDNNVKAARILQQHLANVPTHLPYELSFTGEEWPLIAKMFCLVRKKDPHLRLNKLYTQALVARRKAKYDYESRTQ